uniref:Ovule protein n=1 Tax=Steinernema glaseri TaxID=37863 RepID=A0A1I8A2K2_9BILA
MRAEVPFFDPPRLSTSLISTIDTKTPDTFHRHRILPPLFTLCLRMRTEVPCLDPPRLSTSLISIIDTKTPDTFHRNRILPPLFTLCLRMQLAH